MFYRWIHLWGNIGNSLYICVRICKTWSYFVDYQCNPRIVQTPTWAITAWEKLLQKIPTFTAVFSNTIWSKRMRVLALSHSNSSSLNSLVSPVSFACCGSPDLSRNHILKSYLCPLFSKTFPAPPFLSLPFAFGYIYLFQVLNHWKCFICREFLVLSPFTYRLGSPSCRLSIGWQRQKCPQRAVEKQKPNFL